MSFSHKEQPDVLVLFDVDGTLTPARLTISDEMRTTLEKLRKKVVIGFVGGSDLSKQVEQLVGRNASTEERNEFEKFDKEHHVRETLVNALKENFADYGLTYSIGGQISFDVFPTGWDKTYALQHVESEGFKEIHFFGDKSYKGGRANLAVNLLAMHCLIIIGVMS
ncbi:hypothetical protein QCA50_019606 [Cerrena zonata]|uniref:Phosphomannomutase n=1 Tax=Cerrena zonata TaxID=2478898 RepID=A0AAW0FAV0_9APHY